MKIRFLLGLGFVVAIVAVVLLGQLVFVLQEAFPTRYSTPMRLPSASDLMGGVDKSVSMMFSLSLGLFVLVGFALRGMDHSKRTGRFAMTAGGAFLAASVFAIYMGFMARNVALYYASFELGSSVSIAGTFIVLQAIGVAGSALCALMLAVEFLYTPPAKTDQPNAGGQ